MSIARVLRLLLLASAIAIALLSGLGADETPRQQLDAARVTLADIDAALNYATNLPTEGPEALADNPKDVPVFRAPETV